MRKRPLIGLVMPTATDEIPAECKAMYPEVNFISRGVNVPTLTPAGFDTVIDRILPAAEQLASQGVEAIMIIGTSLTFYRGRDFNEQLRDKVGAATGLPTSTMSTAIIEGLKQIGASKLAVSTAYVKEVNDRLIAFLNQYGLDTLSLEGFSTVKFGDATFKTEQEIFDLSLKAHSGSEEADSILICCGGLRTLEITRPLEEQCGVPVVSSMPAAIWASVRLAGESGFVGDRYGRLLGSS